MAHFVNGDSQDVDLKPLDLLGNLPPGLKVFLHLLPSQSGSSFELMLDLLFPSLLLYLPKRSLGDSSIPHLVLQLSNTNLSQLTPDHSLYSRDDLLHMTELIKRTDLSLFLVLPGLLS